MKAKPTRLKDSYDGVLLAIQQLSDRAIAYKPAFAKLAGSVTAGVFLSQAAYWSNRSQMKDGWFWKSAADWEAETCLTLSEQQTARRKLKTLGLIEEQKKGVPCTLHYRVRFDTILGLLGDRQFMGIPQTGLRESYKLADGKTPSQFVGIPQTIDPEITQETSNREESAGTAGASALWPSGQKPEAVETFDLVPIPDGLRSPEFDVAWREWAKHRREIKAKLTPTTAEKQLRMLVVLGVVAAVELINISIQNGWRGLFPDALNGKRRNNGNGNGVLHKAEAGQRQETITVPTL